MRWAEHVARTGEKRYACNVLVGNPEGKGQVEDLGVNGRIIFK